MFGARLCVGIAACVLASLCEPVLAGNLNDTGVVSCYDANGSVTGTVSGETPLPESTGFEGQDCTRGRAAADAQGVLSKTGGGALGFDFTKIANNGSELPATAALGNNPGDWACTRDNHTGLVWEVKLTGGSSARDGAYGYAWHSTDTAINGGNAGSTSGGNCNTVSPCITSEFVAHVNSASLCGFTDWRLPSVQELQSIVRYQGGSYTDGNYLPNLALNGAPHWSATNFAPNAEKAWAVDFWAAGSLPGSVAAQLKSTSSPIILVRDSP